MKVPDVPYVVTQLEGATKSVNRELEAKAPQAQAKPDRDSGR